MVTDSLRVLHLSTHDCSGGAARAAYRLHDSLRLLDVQSQMLVRYKTSSDNDVLPVYRYRNRLRRIQNRLAYKLNVRLHQQYTLPPNTPYWSVNWYLNNIADIVNQLKPDVVHLHWVGDGFVPYRAISKINKPIVWTLHDSWAFTGGCHMPNDCERFTDTCGRCPQLASSQEHDLSRRIHQHKQQAWEGGIPMRIVAPSQWLAGEAKRSSLFRDLYVQVIPHGIDTTIYKPLDKAVAREALNLPQDKKLILFGATGGTSDPRKGFAYLQEALNLLSPDEDIELVVFGSDSEVTLNSSFSVNNLGVVRDALSLVLASSASDVFVIPSLQEPFGLTLLESLACGTPGVGFDIGGIPDMIVHHANGYLASPADSLSLAESIQWVIDDSDRWQRLSSKARETVLEKFTLQLMAERYLELYRALL